MRYKKFKIVATIVSELAGIACLVVALFAFQLGLDNNVTPGTLRKVLGGLGVLLMIAPLGVKMINRFFQFIKLPYIAQKVTKKWKEYLKSAEVTGTAKSLPNSFVTTNAFFWCSLGVILVFFCSLWYLSSGRWIHFNYYSNYYDLQAEGFLTGQTSLLVEPSNELLVLEDPYDWRARVGIETIWDASLYQGKYY
ncbi:hypothetical protein EG832_18585, partial [bacterium]|nr:hypothetical protein [bacterium]